MTQINIKMFKSRYNSDYYDAVRGNSTEQILLISILMDRPMYGILARSRQQRDNRFNVRGSCKLACSYKFVKFKCAQF